MAFEYYVGDDPTAFLPPPLNGMTSGWICPRCSSGNAPWSSHCPCVPAQLPTVFGLGANPTTTIDTTILCHCRGSDMGKDVFGRCMSCFLPR